jgi:hypothetical protein
VENKLVEPVENKPGENPMNKRVTDTMQGEQSYAVSWQQGGLVEGFMNMEREEQQLQAASNTSGEDRSPRTSQVRDGYLRVVTCWRWRTRSSTRWS